MIDPSDQKGKTPCDDRAPHGWNISTAMAYLGKEIAALDQKVDLKLKAIDDKISARDKALDLQSEANKVHFDQLNHEGARILKATEITVSRDTWDSFIESDRAWKSNADRALQSLLPRSEFQTYKDATEKALTLKAGQSQGMGTIGVISMGIVAGVASLVSVATLVYNIFRPH